MRLLCLWLPNWAIQRLVAARSELKDRPVLLYEFARGARRVSAFSHQAREAGVRVGMSLAEAEAGMGEGGAGSVGFVAARDLGTEREELEALAVWCQRFSPAVGVEDLQPPESLLLDITGLARLFGGEAALTRRVLGELAERGLVVRAAVADTVGAAWAMAHFAPAESRLSLRESSAAGRYFRGAKGDTLGFRNRNSLAFVVPPGRSAVALGPLPVEGLRLGGELVELLHALGIRRIEQLQRLPRDEVVARLGPLPAERWDQAVGTLSEPINARPLPPALKAEHLLDYPIAKREAIELILEQLIGEVTELLITAGQGALGIRCRLECRPGGPVDVAVALFEPSVATRHLTGLVRFELERVALPGPVVAVSVEATTTVPFDRPQEELFFDRAGRRPRRLAALVDRLASRLGRGGALGVRLVRDAQPEMAYEYQPLVVVGGGKKVNGKKVTGTICRNGPSGAKHKWCLSPFSRRARAAPAKAGTPTAPSRTRPLRAAPAEAGTPTGPRPLCLLRCPEPLGDVRLAGDGSPASLRRRRQVYEVRRAWGPERIETGWWRGPMIARDYYRMELADGRRWWVYREMNSGAWFLHGMFD